MSEFDNEPNRNPSDNEPFSAILERSWSRRHVMKGGLGLAAITLFGGFGLANATSQVPEGNAAIANGDIALGFDSLPGSKTDGVVVPAGYTAHVLAPWGTPLNDKASAWKADGSNTASDQLNSVGMHHDGMHFFAIDGRSDDGILVINNEYIDQDALHPHGATIPATTPASSTSTSSSRRPIGIPPIPSLTTVWPPAPSTWTTARSMSLVSMPMAAVNGWR